jgi:hypothetical protein
LSTQSAAALLQLAREQLDRAKENQDDQDQVFVWSFWGLENAIMAAATHAGISSIKQHWAKAEAARKLAKQHGLPDVSELLRDLNDGRKSAAYGDTEEPDREPSEVLSAFEEYVDTVADFLKKPLKKSGRK